MKVLKIDIIDGSLEAPRKIKVFYKYFFIKKSMELYIYKETDFLDCKTGEIIDIPTRSSVFYFIKKMQLDKRYI